MSFIKNLQDIGLSKKEAEIYLACFKLGKAKASDIAKMTDLPRTSVYNQIRDLVNKGYVKKTKVKSVEFFVPIEPKEILNDVQEKVENFSNVLPKMEKLADFTGAKPKLEFFDTKEGLIKLYELMLGVNHGEVVYAIESGEAIRSLAEKVGWELMLKWQKKSLDKGIIVQEVITQDIISFIQTAPENIKVILRQRPITDRVVDEKLFPFPINLYLIGPDNVFVAVPQQNFALILENIYIYKSFVTLFKNLFERAERFDVKDI